MLKRVLIAVLVVSTLFLVHSVIWGDQKREVSQVTPEIGPITDVSGWYALKYDLPYDDQDLESICELKRETLQSAFRMAQTKLASLPGQGGPAPRNDEEIIKAHHQLGQLYSYQGQLGKAVEQFEAAYRIAGERGLKDTQLSLEKKLGIANMRRGELENCVENRHALSCIFPLRPEARHKLVSGSEAAVRHFLKYLEQNPGDLEIRWLLNIAYMTLGKYPEAVPKQHLVPPAALQSEEDIGRFADVAASLDLDTFNNAGGVIVDDFDNDGFLDIVISSQDACEPLHYFHNNGDGTFTERTSQGKLDGQLGGLNLIQTDYNNDGWLDILVMRGGWEVPMRRSLLRNNRDGTFTDVTSQSGLAVPAHSSQTAAWGDFDNDGNLDLFVGNENAPSQLFRNRGDGTFEDVSAKAGVNRVAFTKGAVWGDYDNDGYLDLYVSNYGSENFLYHNNRDGTFTEVARQLHVEKPIQSFPVWFWDYNNDGWLDLFVSSYFQSVAEVARGYLGMPTQGETMKLYKNLGNGSFQDVTREARLDRVFLPMGANFGDVDNDGYLDFYLGTGTPSYAALVPNVLFHNREGRYFTDITSSSATGHLQKGHGIAFADLNNDGTEDIFLHSGGAVPGDRAANLLFRNPGHGNHWITIRLVGKKTNRAAIGARIKVTVTEAGRQRSIHRVVSSGGSFGASPLQQHLGLGKAVRIDTLEIWWPTSNTRQTFQSVAADQSIQVTEFAAQYEKLQRRSFQLGSSQPHHHTH